MTHVMLTVDVETDAGSESLRGIDEALPLMLDVLDSLSARAVFFVVGSVVHQRSDSIRELIKRGHVVASHSMTHPKFSELSVAAQREELRASKETLEAVTGRACVGFRAPFFDAPHDLGVQLEATGYRWSSSKAPFSLVAKYRHVLARNTHALEGTSVREWPVSSVLGLPLPEGLSWRRLFSPLATFAAPPAVFYWHPYDLLDAPDNAGFGNITRRLMQFRSGKWSREYLLELLRGWKSRGAVLAPPEGVV